MDPESSATLKYYETDPNDRAKITFHHTVTEKDGARIFLQPQSSAGDLDNIYFAKSPLYTGTSSKTVVISVGSKEPSVLVDNVKVLIKAGDLAEILSETYQDVSFTFSEIDF